MTARTNTRLKLVPVRLPRETRPPFIAYASLFLLGLLSAAGAATLRDYVRQWNQRELVRVTSTDGRVDAVFAQPVHSWFGKRAALYLVPKGDPVSPSDALLNGTAFTEPPKLVWRKPQLLEMIYGAGCINGFTNVWHSDVIEGGNYFVEVRLEPTRKFVCNAGEPSNASLVGEASTYPEQEEKQ